jgi:hypothetical protein
MGNDRLDAVLCREIPKLEERVFGCRQKITWKRGRAGSTRRLLSWGNEFDRCNLVSMPAKPEEVLMGKDVEGRTNKGAHRTIPVSARTSQTIMSVSCEPEASREPILSNARLVIAF